MCVGKCAGSRSVGRPRKRWNDTVEECLRKRGLDVRQAWRVVQDRSERGCFEDELVGRNPRDEPFTSHQMSLAHFLPSDL